GVHSLFICTEPAPTTTSTLSLHDALPISSSVEQPFTGLGLWASLPEPERRGGNPRRRSRCCSRGRALSSMAPAARSEVRSRERSDRKSTRLNSSHVSISYAVFCLKKKKTK